MKRTENVAVICLSLVIVATIASCRRASSPLPSSNLRVSLCELYKNPGTYDGKTITVSSTITQLPSGKYLYPMSSCDNGFSFVKVDTDHVRNSALTELESSGPPPLGRKEFDLEITGTFDGKYTEPLVGFRYRIVPIEIKPQSPVRIGKPLGAA